MMPSRSRAFLLAEMLPVLLLVGTGSTLMAVGFGAILRSHRQAAGLANRYAVLNDFLDCVRRDVRSADGVVLKHGPDTAAPATVVLRYGTRELLYHLQDDLVVRSGDLASPVADKSWKMDHTDVTVVVEPSSDSRGCLLKLTVVWQSRSKDGLQPRRRFETTLRCAKEVSGE